MEASVAVLVVDGLRIDVTPGSITGFEQAAITIATTLSSTQTDVARSVALPIIHPELARNVSWDSLRYEEWELGSPGGTRQLTTMAVP
jgi:hypothetical protein